MEKGYYIMPKMICSKCKKTVSWEEYDCCGGCSICAEPVEEVIYPKWVGDE